MRRAGHEAMTNQGDPSAMRRRRSILSWALFALLGIARARSSPPLDRAHNPLYHEGRRRLLLRTRRAHDPYLDALTAEGLRYGQAYSQSNWTLPSYASLFTGLLPSQHGALSAREPLATSFTTMAERLGERGYETFALNENPWVGNEEFAITQGFDHLVNMASDFWLSPPSGGLASGDIAEELEAWLVERPVERPFFLFVNIMDAHAPYAVAATNPHLPAGTTADEARAASQRPADHVCQTGAEAREMQILHGLYL